MKRRTFLSMAAAVVAMLALAFTVGATSASAQNPNCCTYTLDFRATIPATCFPITVITEWGPGVTQTFTAAAPGVYTDNVPPPCPPSLPFNWVQVPGGPIVPLGATGTVVLPCGYALTYFATLDAAGCIYLSFF